MRNLSTYFAIAIFGECFDKYPLLIVMYSELNLNCGGVLHFWDVQGH